VLPLLMMLLITDHVTQATVKIFLNECNFRALAALLSQRTRYLTSHVEIMMNKQLNRAVGDRFYPEF